MEKQNDNKMTTKKQPQRDTRGLKENQNVHILTQNTYKDMQTMLNLLTEFEKKCLQLKSVSVQ